MKNLINIKLFYFYRLGKEEFIDYLEKRFEFSQQEIPRFNSWGESRQYKKQMRKFRRQKEKEKELTEAVKTIPV